MKLKKRLRKVVSEVNSEAEKEIEPPKKKIKTIDEPSQKKSRNPPRRDKPIQTAKN